MSNRNQSLNSLQNQSPSYRKMIYLKQQLLLGNYGNVIQSRVKFLTQQKIDKSQQTQFLGGAASYMLERYQQAESLFRKAMQFNQHNYDNYNNLACALIKLKKFKYADLLLTEAVNHQAHPTYYWNLYRIAEENGKKKQAQQYLQLVKQKEKYEPQYKALKGLVYSMDRQQKQNFDYIRIIRNKLVQTIQLMINTKNIKGSSYRIKKFKELIEMNFNLDYEKLKILQQSKGFIIPSKFSLCNDLIDLLYQDQATIQKHYKEIQEQKKQQCQISIHDVLINSFQTIIQEKDDLKKQTQKKIKDFYQLKVEQILNKLQKNYKQKFEPLKRHKQQSPEYTPGYQVSDQENEDKQPFKRQRNKSISKQKEVKKKVKPNDGEIQKDNSQKNQKKDPSIFSSFMNLWKKKQ